MYFQFDRGGFDSAPGHHQTIRNIDRFGQQKFVRRLLVALCNPIVTAGGRVPLKECACSSRRLSLLTQTTARALLRGGPPGYVDKGPLFHRAVQKARTNFRWHANPGFIGPTGSPMCGTRLASLPKRLVDVELRSTTETPSCIKILQVVFGTQKSYTTYRAGQQA
jgi:hypothetical protein